MIGSMSILAMPAEKEFDVSNVSEMSFDSIDFSENVPVTNIGEQ